MSFKTGRKASTASTESFHRRSLRRLQKWLQSDGDTESIRTINEQLFQELEELIMQYRTLRTYVEQLGCNYKKSKDMLILHRYSSLKAMIKLLVVQSKTLAASSALTASKPTVIVTNCDSAESSSTPRRSSVAVGEFALQRKLSNKRNEAQRKRNERREDMSNLEMQDENAEVEAQIKRFRSQIILIKDLVTSLEHQYNVSKMYQPLARYHLLKRMIRTLLNDEAVKTNLLTSLPKQQQTVLTT